MAADPLSALTASAISLLETSRLQPSPFPSPPNQQSPSAHLAQARALNRQLRAQLNQLHIQVVARRKAQEELRLRRDRPPTAAAAADPTTRELQLIRRLDELRGMVQEEAGVDKVREGIVNALNHSYAINASLSRASTASATDLDQALPPLLNQRDQLSLSLLALQRETSTTLAARARGRRKLLALNRSNAEMVKELKEGNESLEVERRVVEGMQRDERKRWDKIKSSTLRQLSGHAIIRNVFQLVVVESGVEWYSPEAFTALPSLPSSSSESMTTPHLLQLMLSAGDSPSPFVAAPLPIPPPAPPAAAPTPRRARQSKDRDRDGDDGGEYDPKQGDVDINVDVYERGKAGGKGRKSAGRGGKGSAGARGRGRRGRGTA